jgi:hypothetical protein
MWLGGSSGNTTTNYRLKVTAGPEYDTSTHQVVPVNSEKTIRLENEHAIVNLCVRIQDYTGKVAILIAHDHCMTLPGELIF